MSEVVLRVEDVSVRYERSLVVHNVSFEVPRGTVYALLGRNGAGKSSLMRCLLGLQKPSSGRVLLFGEDVWRHRARLLSRVAYVPESPDVPGALRVRDVISFQRSLYEGWEEKAVVDRLSRSAIPPLATVSALSKGQRALFALALALGCRPALLILDDPTLGLDVVARRDFFAEFVGDLADRGTTVVLTTHDLGGVEGIADRVGILQEGRLAVDDEVEKLKADREQSLEEIFMSTTANGERS